MILINAVSFNALAQGPGTISKPGYEEYYEYDNASWVHIYNTTSTYDSIGRLTMIINTTPNTNQNISKRENIYSTTTQPTGITKTGTETAYEWQNNTWVITSMFANILILNASNQLTESIWQDYINGALTNSRKKGYIYDASGNLIDETEYLWSNNAWSNFQRRTYTYIQGIRTEQLIHNYNAASASWNPMIKFIYAGWHIPNQQPTMTTWQSKDASGNWKATTRATYTPGANGSMVEISEDFINNTWVLKGRQSRLFDTQGNRTDQIFERYINSAWKLNQHHKFLNTYTPQNDLQQLIIQVVDTASGISMNDVKFVYSNFQYFNRNGLGVNENQLLKLDASVFPNPATHKINIRLADQKRQTLTATVSDLTGKIWQTQTFGTEEKQLNLEALPKGMYLLQLQTEAGSVVKRIVKQ